MSANEETALIQTLEEAGLDGEYWAGILQHQLGIYSVDQISYLSSRHYNILRKHIMDEREDTIIKKLLNNDPKPGSGQCGTIKSKHCNLRHPLDMADRSTVLQESTKSTTHSIKKEVVVNVALDSPVPPLDSPVPPGTEHSFHQEKLDLEPMVIEDSPIRNVPQKPLPQNEIPKTEDTPQSDLSQKLSQVLSQLGLTKYYPGKLTLQEAVSVRTLDTSQGTLSQTDLPWHIVHKLLLSDFNARDDILEKSEPGQDSVVDNSDIDILYDFIYNSEPDHEKDKLSTVDVLLVIFSCCDSFLKQTLAEKLFLCKLAIPFLCPIESELMLSLWALRTIDLNGKSATDDPLPVVSFLRLGTPLRSKSKLLNDILNENNHHTFVNYHSKNGPVRRQCSDGLVECGWFVQNATESKTETVACTTTFLNLRGNAYQHERQRQLLCKLSSVVVVIVTASDLPAYKTTFKELKDSAQKVLLVLQTQTGDTAKYKEDLKQCFQDVGKDNLQAPNCRLVLDRSKIGRVLNENEIRSSLCHSLSEMLMDCRTKSLQESIKGQKEVITDEDILECHEGKTLASDLFNDIIRVEVDMRKDSLLPLQQEVWKSYCESEKKLHRTSAVPDSSTLEEHKENMKKDMKAKRAKQMKLLSKSIGMKFIRVLQGTDEITSRYFLTWLKLMLDKESRATLTELRQKYGEQWDQLQATKEGKTTERQEIQQKNVKHLERILANASIGVEHLFREVAQIYEAVHGNYDTNIQQKRDISMIPKIAAKLLMNGYPLELLDGDASGIPLTWMRAVLDQLSKFIRQKQLFVVSVMGVQSSGKSTLLNTMFGLKFAVSAGRCTRGAFMQLIPVHSTCDFEFSYVLVFDTEGLRAPELEAAKHAYDNELATLAVGLADVTVINVKGENTSEIKDILQIVVHAFLRMSAVNKKQKYRHTCVFIHQNVADTNASEMMMHGRHKLVDTLDTMAKEAAASEGIQGVRTFSDIIKFDSKKHNWYFPDLWNGNPPMAPVNPKYSHNVQSVRCSLFDIANNQYMFSFAADLFSRINDIWHGILCDDFVFSFRNTLELKAYVQLNSKYNVVICDLQAMTRSFIRDTATKQFSICQRSDELNGVSQRLIATLSRKIQEKADSLKENLEAYFKNNEYNEIIIQWKQTKLLGLSNEAEKLQQDNIETLRKKADERKVVIITEIESSPHIKAISQKATELADRMKGKNISEVAMKNMFENFIAKHFDFDVREKNESFPFASEFQNVLRKIYEDKSNHLQEEYDQLNSCGSIEKYLTDENINRGIISNAVGKFTSIFRRPRQNDSVKFAIFKRTSTRIQDKYTAQCPPQREDISQVFHIMDEEINQSSPQMLVKDRIKLSVAVKKYALEYFTHILDEHSQKYSVSAHLKSYRESIWDIFKNTVHERSVEVIAADLFCDQVKKLIPDKAHSQIADTLIGEVLRDFSHNKYHLIVNMLKELAEREDFNDYVKYISSLKDYAASWLENYFNKSLLHRATEVTKYLEVMKPDLYKVFRNIYSCIDKVTQVMKTGATKQTSHWIRYVCTKVDLPLTESALQLMKEREVKDFDHLKKCIGERLEELMRQLLHECEHVTPSNIHWPDDHPHKQILERLWGCDQVCPFCGEPCSNTRADHYETEKTCHTCIKHKPQGIGGWYWRDSEKLVLKTCGYLIHENAQFACDLYRCRPFGKCTTREQKREPDDIVWHGYRDYKTYIPDWDIQPDPSDSMSKYWQWFMARFIKELTENYGRQLPDMPDSWKSITKEEAINDLTTVYNP